MDSPPLPTCWRCGGRQTRPWFTLTYFCQNCANRKITKRIADQQATQFKWERQQSRMQQQTLQQRVYHENPQDYFTTEVTASEPASSTSVVEGTIATLAGIVIFFIMGAAICGVAWAIWQRIMHPVITFMSFGFL